MPSPFKFVNVSNAPRLGPKERREMRAHITQTNFAKRRQRLAKVRDDNKSDGTKKKSTLESQQFQLVQASKDGVAILDPGCDRLLTNVVDSTYSPIGYCTFISMNS
jgi:hypothetical protein